MSTTSNRWNRKIVGLFTGCFCPPHKGHYDMVVESIQKFKLNVVVVRIYGSPEAKYSRHGIDENGSVNIWTMWGKRIKKLYKADVIPVTVDNDLSFIPENIGYLFDIYVADNKEDYEREEKEQTKITVARNVPDSIKSRALVMRDFTDDLSATKFTKCLLENRDCLRFVPDDFSRKEKIAYINYLQQNYNLYVKYVQPEQNIVSKSDVFVLP